MFLAFLMFLSVIVSTLVSIFYEVPLLLTGSVNSIIFIVGSAAIFRKYEKERALNLLNKLSRFAQDFHELALKVDSQDKDTRIVRVIDSIPYHDRAESKIPSEQIHIIKRSVGNAQTLVNAWFDEYEEKLDFFINNPTFLVKNFGALIKGFRRLLFEYHGKVVKESIDFMNEAGKIEKNGFEKFNKFKVKYNDLTNRFRSFLKDVEDAGYGKHTETGWDVDGIFEELEVEILK